MQQKIKWVINNSQPMPAEIFCALFLEVLCDVPGELYGKPFPLKCGKSGDRKATSQRISLYCTVDLSDGISTPKQTKKKKRKASQKTSPAAQRSGNPTCLSTLQKLNVPRIAWSGLNHRLYRTCDQNSSISLPYNWHEEPASLPTFIWDQIVYHIPSSYVSSLWWKPASD